MATSALHLAGHLRGQIIAEGATQVIVLGRADAAVAARRVSTDDLSLAILLPSRSLLAPVRAK